MDEQIVINKQDNQFKFKCIECENEITVPEGLDVGDFFDCDFCGLEYEVVSLEGDKMTVAVREDEK